MLHRSLLLRFSFLRKGQPTMKKDSLQSFASTTPALFIWEIVHYSFGNNHSIFCLPVRLSNKFSLLNIASHLPSLKAGNFVQKCWRKKKLNITPETNGSVSVVARWENVNQFKSCIQNNFESDRCPGDKIAVRRILSVRKNFATVKEITKPLRLPAENISTKFWKYNFLFCRLVFKI